MRPRRVVGSLLCLVLCAQSQLARAQARPTASGPGAYVAVGAGVSQFQADYGKRQIGGVVMFADVQPYWRVGLEGEVRYLRLHAAEDVTESTYVGGLRAVILRSRSLEVYGKFLAGVGRIVLPFGYARGSFLTYAPGAGVDVDVSDRVSVRAVDFEYQSWPQFRFGPLHPYGFSTGIRVRVNAIRRLPRR